VHPGLESQPGGFVRCRSEQRTSCLTGGLAQPGEQRVRLL